MLLFIFTFYALSFNGMDIGFVDCIFYVFNHILGTTYEPGSPEWMDDYILWKKVIRLRISLKPITYKLLVKRRLTMTCLITI